MNTPVVRLSGISKKFGTVKTLENVSLSLYPGRISCLIGENGAGKTTLMKIMMGIISSDAGSINFKDKPVIHNHPGEAHRNGFRMVYQEPELVEHLTVLDNIFLNYESLKLGIILNRQEMMRKAKEVMNKLNCSFEIEDKVQLLSFSQKRKVCIAAAALHQPEILILDEPTNSMVHDDIQALFSYLKELQQKNVSIVYISHKLSESMLIADEIIVLRDGRLIKQESQDKYNPSSILTDITGDDLLNRYPRINHKTDRTILYAENLTATNNSIRNCSISLKKGEILGITGLQGARKTILGKALYGLVPLKNGEIIIHGKKSAAHNPVASIKNKIAYISENIYENIDFNRNCFENVTITNLDKISIGPFVLNKKSRKTAFDLLLKLHMRNSIDMPLEMLNGGALQKIVLAKWLNTDCDIFIFNEPTQHLDISSKVEFYNILNKMTEDGKSILLISSDFEEILGMSDRIIIMHEGQIIKKMINYNLCSKDLIRSASMYTE